MQITDVKATPITFKLEKPLGWFGWEFRHFVIVQVYTDEEITGVGESSDCYGHQMPRAVVEVIEGELKRLLLGEDPAYMERLVKKMQGHCLVSGLQGIVSEAISGVEIALWDIVGKARGEPVYKLLGGYRDKVKVYASTNIGLWENSLKEQAKDAARLVEQGYTAIKVRGGRSAEWDEELVRTVRDVIGDDVDLLYDAFMQYTPTTAIKMAKKLMKYNIYFLEEPLPPYDIDGLARITATVDVPVATGEHVYTIYGFKDLITKKAADIFQPDPTISGGLLECKKICAMAQAWGIPCIPHVFASAIGQVASLHLMASTPNCPMGEYDESPFNPLRDELLTDPTILDVKKSYVELPKKPGLGIEINEQLMANYPYKELAVERKLVSYPRF